MSALYVYKAVALLLTIRVPSQMTTFLGTMNVSLGSQYLEQLPAGFSASDLGSTWGFYSTLKTAAIPDDFNRTGELER